MGVYRIWGLGFPKIRGSLLGVSIIRIIVFWNLYLGTPMLGNYYMGVVKRVIGGPFRHSIGVYLEEPPTLR